MKERIRKIREDAGLTLAAFGERLGVTMNYVYMMESGRREPSPATMREICRQFGVWEEWLLTGDGPQYRDLTPALDAADKVRRLLVDAPKSTAATVVSALLELDPFGPEWEVIGRLLARLSAGTKKDPEG